MSFVISAYLSSMVTWAATRTKIYKLVCGCHQLLSGLLANGHLVQMSGQLRLLDNGMGKNEMIQGTLHKSPGIYFTAELKLAKPQLGNRLINDVRLVFASDWVPYLQMTSVGSHNMSGRKKEGMKEMI